MPFDLNAKTAGIPNKVLIPGVVVVVAGGYIFYKKYSTAQTAALASTTGATSTTTSTTPSSTAYGPTLGNGALNVYLPPNGTKVSTASNTSGKNNITQAQIAWLTQATQALWDLDQRSAVGVAALADNTPGAVPDIIGKWQSGWEAGQEQSNIPPQNQQGATWPGPPPVSAVNSGLNSGGLVA